MVHQHSLGAHVCKNVCVTAVLCWRAVRVGAVVQGVTQEELAVYRYDPNVEPPRLLAMEAQLEPDMKKAFERGVSALVEWCSAAAVLCCQFCYFILMRPRKARWCSAVSGFSWLWRQSPVHCTCLHDRVCVPSTRSQPFLCTCPCTGTHTCWVPHCFSTVVCRHGA